MREKDPRYSSITTGKRTVSRSSLLQKLVLRQAEPALTALIIQQRRQKVPLHEIRPEGVGEIELGVSGLPEKKIADAFLAARPDDQVRVRQLGGIEEGGKGLSLQAAALRNLSFLSS